MYQIIIKVESINFLLLTKTKIYSKEAYKLKKKERYYGYKPCTILIRNEEFAYLSNTEKNI